MLDFHQSIKADPDSLQEGVNLLRRIAEALERLSPPVLAVADRDIKQTTAADVRVVDPTIASDIELIKDRFAIASKTVVNSEAFWQAMYEAEEFVARSEGEENVDQLEWNKYGRLFDREQYYKRQIQRKREARDKAAQQVTQQAPQKSQEQDGSV